MKNAISRLYCKGMASATLLLAGTYARADLKPYDLTKDQSGGKTFKDVANNVNDATALSTALFLNIMAFAGYIIIASCLFILYRASKDDGRERPLSAIVGLVMGGLMAAIGTVAWIIRNTVVG